jgi:hypothetical protein
VSLPVEAQPTVAEKIRTQGIERARFGMSAASTKLVLNIKQLADHM